MGKMLKICTALALLLALIAALWMVRDLDIKRQTAASGEDGARPWPMVSALPVILVFPALRRINWYANRKQIPRNCGFCPENGAKSKLF